MPMGEDHGIALDRPHPGDHPIDAGTHLLGRLAAGAAIPEDQPARRELADLLRRQPLIFAVVPLGQIGLDDRLAPEARDLAGLPARRRGLTRTRAKASVASMGRRRWATRRPLSVRGISVVPVC